MKRNLGILVLVGLLCLLVVPVAGAAADAAVAGDPAADVANVDTGAADATVAEEPASPTQTESDPVVETQVDTSTAAPADTSTETPSDTSTDTSCTVSCGEDTCTTNCEPPCTVNCNEPPCTVNCVPTPCTVDCIPDTNDCTDAACFPEDECAGVNDCDGQPVLGQGRGPGIVRGSGRLPFTGIEDIFLPVLLGIVALMGGVIAYRWASARDHVQRVLAAMHYRRAERAARATSGYDEVRRTIDMSNVIQFPDKGRIAS